jgi:hypothetical protein
MIRVVISPPLKLQLMLPPTIVPPPASTTVKPPGIGSLTVTEEGLLSGLTRMDNVTSTFPPA